VLTFAELQAMTGFKQRIPKKPVVLTFSPHADNFLHAYPLLKKYSCPGLFLVQTDQQPYEGSALITTAQARQLAADGFEIGSASRSSPKMNLLSEQEMLREVAGSKAELETSINTPVTVFAYPRGFVNEALKRLVIDAGYRFGLCLDEGRRNFWKDPYKVRRIQIFGGASKFSFWKKTSGRYLWYSYVY
jgi:peptidoglycan/xylan/chitin deacetylase (PgdA/CDA1 family)